LRDKAYRGEYAGHYTEKCREVHMHFSSAIISLAA
jgi:hypothetical protein